MRTPWAAWKARQARRARLDAITQALALAAAQECIERGAQVPRLYDLSTGEGLATVTYITQGARASGPRHRRSRRA
jgi:hypothetical protein